MNFSSLAAVVLCAGKGTRMNSSRAKVLHPLLGRPMCWYPVSRAFEVGASNVVPIVGHQSDEVKRVLSEAFSGRPLSFALQAEQKGTGHAVGCAQSALENFRGAVLILSGDVPLITSATLQRLMEATAASVGPLGLVSARPPDPSGYGRLVRERGEVQRIVEHKDASPAELDLGEVNAGIYLADAQFLFAALKTLTPSNAQGELYLTDIVAQAAKLGPVAVVEAAAEETAGINDRAELAARTKRMQARINAAHLKAGVTMLSPETTFIDEGVEIGADSVLGPNVTLCAGSRLGREVKVGQGCVVTRCVVGDGVELKPYSVLDDSTVGPACFIGPFARLRPGSELAEGVHLGNFVETKKSRLGKGTKANHLAYLGDAEVGEGCNIGAGTITCNYDGVNKHPTKIGDRVFIGSDSQLVAPVSIGTDAYVGAGTTLVEDVPAGALTLSRAPQVIKEGWAERRKKVLAGMKSK
jgi:bifunctional UDP-N-acetylglucosamine pyrophosphorylase/glucosamine-1-phosphate N-acetyltransferase